MCVTVGSAQGPEFTHKSANKCTLHICNNLGDFGNPCYPCYYEWKLSDMNTMSFGTGIPILFVISYS